MIREQLQRLLAKSVTRREFLGYVGVLFLTIVGVSSLLKSIGELTTSPAKPAPIKPVNQGYGSNGYGA